jgi:hypothetical protein
MKWRRAASQGDERIAEMLRSKKNDLFPIKEIPPLGNAELVQMQIRVIALENLLITLLAEGSDRQLEVAREIAAYISPRPGFTQHPLTVRAAGLLSISSIERFITEPSTPRPDVHAWRHK